MVTIPGIADAAPGLRPQWYATTAKGRAARPKRVIEAGFMCRCLLRCL
jgi:hypothetical protein